MHLVLRRPETSATCKINLYVSMSKENRGHYKARMEIIAKFRINFLVLYNKDFEKITLF